MVERKKFVACQKLMSHAMYFGFYPFFKDPYFHLILALKVKNNETFSADGLTADLFSHKITSYILKNIFVREGGLLAPWGLNILTESPFAALLCCQSHC